MSKNENMEENENNNENRDNLLVLNKLTDLLKISPDKLKTAQYSDFCGKYFQQIKEEVIKSEKNQKKEENILNNDSTDNNLTVNRKKNNNISFIKYKGIQVSGYNEHHNNDNYEINNDMNASIPNQPFNYIHQYTEDIYSFHIKKIIFNLKYNTIFGQEIAISGSNNKLGNWDKHNLLFLQWNEGNIWIGELDIDENYEDFEFKFVLCYNKEIIKWEPGENNNVYFSALFNELKENCKGKFNKYEYDYDKINEELTLKCFWPQ